MPYKFDAFVAACIGVSVLIPPPVNSQEVKIVVNGIEFKLSERGAIKSETIWPFPALSEEKNILVCWENQNSNNKEKRQSVQNIVSKTWEKESRLKFIGWNSCGTQSRGIRILIEDSGPHTKGLGRQLDGVEAGMVLNFEFNNWQPACQKGDKDLWIEQIAVHEFGHAIGFTHEHNRSDTPAWCTNSPQGTNPDVILTPWDKESVMNYCFCDDKVKLSDFDINAVKALY